VKKKSKSRLGKLRWKELSEKIRKEKPNCEYCGKPATQVHHAISKFYRKSMFRFDEKNLVSLCGRCHISEFHKNPVGTMKWFRDHRNEDWIHLIRRLEGMI
jgi:5-methylcytosine-specific restriction endonuclease McrA